MCNHCPEGLPERKPEMNLDNTRTTAGIENELAYQNTRVASYQTQYNNCHAQLQLIKRQLDQAERDRDKVRTQLRTRYNNDPNLDV